ncbi:MAG TPA: hypothetical protein VGQ17_02710 [Gemmatimonadales bacterium]|jgi:hypothetical protein|nr:hypothetical protein [Gemmatimonadales bacterium]
MFAPLLSLAVLLSTDVPPLTVRVDSKSHEVILTLGPFHLAASPTGEDHAGMHHGGHGIPLLRFAWPAGGWVRGFRISIHDGEGRPLSRRLLHHVNLLHLERRQLLEPVFERTIALGQETDDVLLPSSVGVRIESGAEMALLSAWANETGEDLHDVMLDFVIPYLPENTMPRPREVRPFAIDLGFGPRDTDAFDVGPGRTVHHLDFVLPTGGRILGAGGHLHDYAESIALVDLTNGKVLFELRTKMDSAGKVSGVGRKLFGVTGNGLRLRAGRPYRVIAIYQNPLGRTLVDGGMAVLAGIFAPDDPARWPELDRTDAKFVADLAGLDRIGWAAIASRDLGGHRH